MIRQTFETLYLEQQTKLVIQYGKFVREQVIGIYRGQIFQYDNFYIILFYHITLPDLIASLVFNSLDDIDSYANNLMIDR